MKHTFRILFCLLILVWPVIGMADEVTFTVEDADPSITSEPYMLKKDSITADFSGGSVYSDHLRLFANQTLTISTSVGVITSITLNCTRIERKEGGPENAKITEGKYTSNGSTGTWTGRAKKVEILADGHQLRFASITVTYIPNGSVELKNPQLAFSKINFTVEPLSDFTPPQLTYADGIDPTRISFSQVGSTEVAAVNTSTGEVTIGELEGMVRVYANYPGDDVFREGTASYTISVVAAEHISVEFSEKTAYDGHYYATLYYGDKSLVVPDDIEAYTYHVSEGRLVVGHRYSTRDAIPAATGVVLKATEAKAYEFAVTTRQGEEDDANMLRGTDVEEVVSDAGYKYYLLTLNNNAPGTIGFYWSRNPGDGSSLKNAAHKAFLAVPEDIAGDIRGFSIGGEIISGIATITSEDTTPHAISDLQGRKISPSTFNQSLLQPGIYIIGNKKIIVK